MSKYELEIKTEDELMKRGFVPLETASLGNTNVYEKRIPQTDHHEVIILKQPRLKYNPEDEIMKKEVLLHYIWNSRSSDVNIIYSLKGGMRD